jgi:hypothetical protein
MIRCICGTELHIHSTSMRPMLRTVFWCKECKLYMTPQINGQVLILDRTMNPLVMMSGEARA